MDITPFKVRPSIYIPILILFSLFLIVSSINFPLSLTFKRDREAWRQQDGAIVLLDDIGETSGPAFREELAAWRIVNPESTKLTLKLMSGGGSLLGATSVVEVMRSIPDVEITTIVPPGMECSSACALIFAAGNRRLLSPNSSMLFHEEDPYADMREDGLSKFLASIFKYPSRIKRLIAPVYTPMLHERSKELVGFLEKEDILRTSIWQDPPKSCRLTAEQLVRHFPKFASYSEPSFQENPPLKCDRM